MRRNRVTEGDLRQKLRGAGLAAVENATLLVLETTSDVTAMTVAGRAFSRGRAPIDRVRGT